jgi:hypothetical protein
LLSELGERSEGFLADISTLSLYDPNAVYCDEVLLDQAAILRMILVFLYTKFCTYLN